MSERQGAAIKAWWAKRFADGTATRAGSEAVLERRRARDREVKRRLRAMNRDAVNAALKKWYVAHRDEQCALRRAERAADPERYRAAEKQRRRDHLARYRELERLRYERHRERELAANTRWRAKNRERVRANARRRDALKAASQIGPVDYAAILAASGGTCGICGESVDTTNPKAYHYDHKIPLARGGAHVQSNIQLAHATCNMRKHAKVA